MRALSSFLLSFLLLLGACSGEAKTTVFPTLALDEKDDDKNKPGDNDSNDDSDDEEDENPDEEVIVSISVAPVDVLMTRGGVQTFTATVVGADNKDVTWSVTEVDGGTITESGNYTAPDLAGVYHVVAKSVADTNQSASVTVTVSDETAISVSVDPATVEVVIGTTQAFVATLTGSNQGVTWYTTGGSITSAGVLTPPSVQGTISVVATANADITKKATATVDVIHLPGSVVVVGPLNVTVDVDGSVDLDASVAGANGKTIDWTVTEELGGTVSGNGVYTAPSTAGIYHVVATSNLDPTQFATFTITVVNPL